MTIRDRIMNAIIEARIKAGEAVGNPDYEPTSFTD
jgi:hypothetical protein